MVDTKEKKKEGGLAGIVAGDSAICLCGVEEQSLRYRGYAIEDLANLGSFEETAYLLLHKKLPTKSEIKQFFRKPAELMSDSPQYQSIKEWSIDDRPREKMMTSQQHK